MGELRQLQLQYQILMGPANSNPFREGGQLLSEYAVTGKNSELFITYLKHKRTGKEHLLREMTFTEERELILNFEKMKSRKNMTSEHLTALERVEERTEDNMCSHYYKIYALWQYPNKSLFDEIKERDLQKKAFENRELWSILACSIMGLSTLQEKDIRHECLTTKAILMDEGNIKVADPMAAALVPNFQCIFSNRAVKNIYLSPEQCEAIESQKPIINKNSFKNDVFTMGMILLQCGLLERQDQCYLDDCSNINWSKIEANVCRFGHVYDQDLKRMLTLMLEKDIRNRPDWADLNQFVDKNINQGNRAEKTLPKRDHFISRTVRSLMPRREGKNEPAVIVKHEPAAVPVNNAVLAPDSTQYEKARVLNQTQSKTITSEVKVVELPPTVSKTFINRPVSMVASPSPQYSIGQGKGAYSPYNSLPKYEPSINTFASTGYHPPSGTNYHSSNPNPSGFPTMQLKEDIGRLTTTNHMPVFIPQKTENTSNYPTFRYTSETNGYDYGLGAKKEMVPAPAPPPSYKPPQLSDLGKVTASLLPKESSFQASYDKQKSGTVQSSFSPLNMSEYIRPAHSIHYQVQRESPTVRKEASNFPLDMKSAKPENIPEASSTPQYVVEHFKVGSKYEGYKLNGLRHGQGKFYYQDGGFYDGHWNNNTMQGFGTLYYQSNHKAYEGYWVNDKFHGHGTLYNDSPVQFDQNFDFNSFDEIDEYWEFYEGNFNGDEKDGQGKLRFSNGEIFEGTFKTDMVEGEGNFTCLDGRQIHGIWRENQLTTLLS